MIDKHITSYWLQSQDWIKYMNNVNHILSLSFIRCCTRSYCNGVNASSSSRQMTLTSTKQIQLTQKCRDSGFLHQSSSTERSGHKQFQTRKVNNQYCLASKDAFYYASLQNQFPNLR